MFSVEVTEVLPDPFAKILDTLRDPHATVTAVRQTFTALNCHTRSTLMRLELRTGLKSEHDLHYQIGTTLPASTTGAATDLDTLRDPHATVTAVRQTFGLPHCDTRSTPMRSNWRTGRKSDTICIIRSGRPCQRARPAQRRTIGVHWGGFYLTHRFQDVELRDASWHEDSTRSRKSTRSADAWVRKRSASPDGRIGPVPSGLEKRTFKATGA